MNPHVLPTGHSYYTTSLELAQKCADKYETEVGRYGMGTGYTEHGVLDKVKSGFMLINWNTLGRSYKDPVST
jgi:hypothetical protein